MNNNIENNNAMEDLKRFLKMLKKHLILIITSTVLTTIIFALALFFFITPKYQATTQLIVNQRTKNAQTADLQGQQNADIQMINTYKSIITSPVISDTVNSNLNNPKQLRNSQISVDTQSNSQVFDINAISSNPNFAAQMANKTAAVFQNKIKDIMNVNNVTVIAKAQVPASPTSPNKKKGLLIGIAVGIAIGILISLYKEYTSRMVNSTDFITDDLKLTNLGIINDIKSKGNFK